MILYSVVLKCLDPVMTIACALAYRDPCKVSLFVSIDGVQLIRGHSFGTILAILITV